jgi:hypothetical protein
MSVAPASQSQQLAVPGVVVHERAWAITYIVSRVTQVAAPTVDDALRQVRDEVGSDVEIVEIRRT